MTTILEKDLDLNQLFHLNYNFDLLKQVIEALVLSNKSLNKRLKDLENNDKTKDLEEQIKNMQNSYDDKFKIIFQRLEKSEDNITDIYSKLDNHGKDLSNHNERLINNQNEIDEINKKIKNIENRLNDLSLKINSLNISNSTQVPIKEDNDLSNHEKFLLLLENLRKAINDKIDNNEKDIKTNKLDIDDLRKDVNELKNQSSQFKLNITILFDKIEELKKLIHDCNNDEMEQRIKKYIDDQLSDIIKRLELKIANLQLKSLDNVSEDDMKLINDLLRRVIELENLYRLIANQPKVDELAEEIRKLWAAMKFKLEKNDLNEIYNKFYSLENSHDALEKRVKRLEDLFNDELADIRDKIDNIMSMLSKTGPVIDMDKYVDINTYNIYKAESNDKFVLIFQEIENLKKQIKDILLQLKDKASKQDLKDLEDLLLSKLEELKLASVKKFADKNETSNNFKLLDDKIKILMEMRCTHTCGKDKERTADNWLLSKMPIGANWCVSCEAYIGDLKENKEFIPWQRWPSKDDKLYRKGNGFSRMLQLINFDQNSEVKNVQNNQQFNGDININVIHGDNINVASSLGSVRNIQTAKGRGKIENLKILPILK